MKVNNGLKAPSVSPTVTAGAKKLLSPIAAGNIKIYALAYLYYRACTRASHQSCSSPLAVVYNAENFVDTSCCEMHSKAFPYTLIGVYVAPTGP